MKKCLFMFLFFITLVGFSQNNHIVKTEDGRRILLKSDYTWEYIDIEKSTPDKRCNLAVDFEEPKLNSKIQSQLKKGRATMDDVKKKVAKDYDCEVADVILLSVSEQKVKAVYQFCANGTKVTYKRTGHAIIQSGKFF
ncbi:DUF3157 family protein [Mariniflexile litorale]|uniref:DUF3157 family protein n=1 Tax=Mariniflexile litorale TaxID=3045158 RepID=A0AAU7EJB3_9FLAO|nr:DUF3157 family protein [Mariniflexile sp. KMM 9835]MDQ8211119.1 DUF3157 family protein [Mariniflexile sp. KMM 9835]